MSILDNFLLYLEIATWFTEYNYSATPNNHSAHTVTITSWLTCNNYRQEPPTDDVIMFTRNWWCGVFLNTSMTLLFWPCSRIVIISTSMQRLQLQLKDRCVRHVLFVVQLLKPNWPSLFAFVNCHMRHFLNMQQWGILYKGYVKVFFITCT